MGFGGAKTWISSSLRGRTTSGTLGKLLNPASSLPKRDPTDHARPLGQSQEGTTDRHSARRVRSPPSEDSSREKAHRPRRWKSRETPSPHLRRRGGVAAPDPERRPGDRPSLPAISAARTPPARPRHGKELRGTGRPSRRPRSWSAGGGSLGGGGSAAAKMTDPKALPSSASSDARVSSGDPGRPREWRGAPRRGDAPSSRRGSRATGNAGMRLCSCPTLPSEAHKMEGRPRGRGLDARLSHSRPRPGPRALQVTAGPGGARGRAARTPGPQAASGRDPRLPLLRPGRPHGPLRPPASLPGTPAASSTYCLKPRPPPWPKLEENGRAPQKCRGAGVGVSPAAPSVSDFWNARTTPPRMPRACTACRARPSGQCSFFCPESS